MTLKLLPIIWAGDGGRIPFHPGTVSWQDHHRGCGKLELGVTTCAQMMRGALKPHHSPILLATIENIYHHPFQSQTLSQVPGI